MKKICYFINSDWYFDLHWRDRALAAKKAGYEIHLLTDFVSDKLVAEYNSLGLTCHNIPINAQSFSIIKFLRAFWFSLKVIKNIKPDLIHCITIKPCIIGGVLARRCECPVIISFVGLGRVFSSTSFMLKILRFFTIPIYQYIANNKKSIFMFEHERDKKHLNKLVQIENKRSLVVDGAGIDVNIYQYSIEKERDVPVVLFASRMLWRKGLGDLIEAKKILQQKNINFTLNVAGIVVDDDKDAIPNDIILKWHSEGLINWLGQSSNVYELIRESNIVALPSTYPEGVPRILLEASSVGRACVAYDIGGCDSLIINDDNGVIIKSNTIHELAERLEFLLKNHIVRVNMGINGHKRVQNKFSNKHIIDKTLQIYNDITVQ